jgi:hypothetical protein
VLAALLALGISVFQLYEASRERIAASTAIENTRNAQKTASESVIKVEALVAQSQAAETKVAGIVAQPQAAEQRMLEIEHNQVLRIWANVLPDTSEILCSGGAS